MPLISSRLRLGATTALLLSFSLAAPVLIAPVEAAAQSAAAQSGNAQAQGAFDFVKSMTAQGLAFLSDRNLSTAQKSAEFRKLLDSSFDLDTIGRFALGRYWNSATQAQKSEYLGLFRRMVVDVYTNRFDQYKGQSVDVRDFRAMDERDTLVTSYLVQPNGGPEVRLDWRVRGKNGSYKIVDVLVESVSMSVTQRSDFSSVIQRGGGNVEALLKQMRSGQAPSSAAR
jgi:phospholipid transport system substrate-binding protein